MDTGSYSTANAGCGCPEPHDQAVDDASQPLWSGDVRRHLHYYSPPRNNERPKFIVTETNGVGYKNYPCINHPVLIRDLRDPLDDEHMQEIYTASAKQLVLAHVPGARTVKVFDQTIRRASTSIKQNRPVRKVHVDQTPNAAKLRARRHLSPQDADEVEQGKLRLRIINVWRPLAGPVVDHPLCLGESGSIQDCDLVEVDHVYVDRVGQTYAVRPPSQAESAHRFWYLSSMEVTDIWLIQCFDSRRDALGRRLRCPHASFEFLEEGTTGCCGQESGQQRQREGKQRASVEVRCLVLGG